MGGERDRIEESPVHDDFLSGPVRDFADRRKITASDTSTGSAIRPSGG